MRSQRLVKAALSFTIDYTYKVSYFLHQPISHFQRVVMQVLLGTYYCQTRSDEMFKLAITAVSHWQAI